MGCSSSSGCCGKRDASPHLGFHGMKTIALPAHLPASIFASLRAHAEHKQPAERDIKYWPGEKDPWRSGPKNEPVTDAAITSEEEATRLATEALDRRTANKDKLRYLGVRVDYLLAMTDYLDLWDWPTWEVVAYLVKPATEHHRRCRFAELPCVRPFTGPATVFMSHCWGGKWGDLVVAAAAGGHKGRVVWVDIFAVRQWPGNSADLEFREVINGCSAVIVAAAPRPGLLVTEKYMVYGFEWAEYLQSDEYLALSSLLPFCRLWCVVEMHAALVAKKPLIFRLCGFGTVTHATRSSGSRSISVEAGEGAVNMLSNFSAMVDVAGCKCAVSADYQREMARIGAEQQELNHLVAMALKAGSVAIKEDVAEVDAFACGEPGALRALPDSGVAGALNAAAASGQLDIVNELLATRAGAATANSTIAATAASSTTAAASLVDNHYPLWISSRHGHADVSRRLLECGAAVDRPDPKWDCTPLYMAAEQGQEAAVRVLLEYDAAVNRAEPGMGMTPLFTACEQGHLSVVRLLLGDAPGSSPGSGSGAGNRGVVLGGKNSTQTATVDTKPSTAKPPLRRNLSFALASLDMCMLETRWSPLFVAAWAGHLHVVEELLKHGPDASTASAKDHLEVPAGSTALSVALLKGHDDMAALLRAYSKKN